MSSSRSAIGIIPLFSSLILAIGLMNHVFVIPPLLQEAKRDAWISVLAATVPLLIWICLLYYIMRSTKQQPIMSWVEQHYGRRISWIIRLSVTVYIALIGVTTVKETAMWTHISYLPRTPILVLSLTLIIPCLYAAYYGLRTISIASGIMLPFVIIFGDLVMGSNIPRKDYTLLTPLLENGWEPVLRGGIYIGGGLAELVVILLLQHHFKSRIRLSALWLLALFVIVLVLGPLTGAIAEFGPYEAALLRYPAYEEWRLVKIGKYITHLDFLSIYQWLSGAVIRLAISLYILVEVLSLQKKRHKLISILSSSILYVILAQLPVSDMQYVTFLNQIYFPVSLAYGVILTLTLLLLIILAKAKERKSDGSKQPPDGGKPASNVPE